MKIIIDTDNEDLNTALDIIKNAYNTYNQIQLEIVPPNVLIRVLCGNVNTVYKDVIDIVHNAGFIFAKENPMASTKFMTSQEFCGIGFSLDQKFGRNPFLQDVTIRKFIELANNGGFEVGYRGVFIDLYSKRQSLYDKAKEDTIRDLVSNKSPVVNHQYNTVQ